MHSLRSYLEGRGVNLRSTPFMSAVWFTHVRARSMLPPSPEWHEWQVLDSEDLRKSAPAAIRRTLALGAAHLDTKTRHFGAGEFGPSPAVAERIAAALRPRFETHVVKA